jgi:serine/threonine-protein kinase ULK/ATG1
VKTRLAGTPAYSSPQMLTNGYYSYLNDMWSLGVLFYEMLHGVNPWVTGSF